MSKKRSTKYTDPLAPLDKNNNPIQVDIKGLPAVNFGSSNQPVGDTGGGDYVGDSYTPNGYDDPNMFTADLSNLDNIRAGNQGIAKSLGNSVAKFVGKTLNNVAGGTIGTLYGAGSAIANGDVTKVWDNSFTSKLDEIDKGLDDIFKVYKTSDYQDQNILQRAFLHPLQFTDDTAEALSFTAGAVVTELLTSGLGTEALLPKALKYMKFLDRGAEAAEATANLASKGNKFIKAVSDGGLLTKRLATGAAYESSVEARQATMQLRDKLYAEWEANNPGQQMPDAVVNDIDDRLSKAGLFTYLSNLALVGSSNIIQFPKLFGLGAKSSAKIAEGSVAKNTATGLFEAVGQEPSRLTSILRKLKNPAEEGLVEEGLQNVVSNTAQDYWSQKHDPNAKQVTDDFLNVFASNLAKTYTSKEGWNDIGMGMIIGGLGAPGRGMLATLGRNNALGKYGYEEVRDNTGKVVDYKRQNLWEGGVFGADVEANAERQQIQEVVDRLNKDTNLFSSMKKNYDTIVRNQVLEDKKDAALQANDLFEFNNAKDDQIHNYVASRIESGLLEDLTDNVDAMKALSAEDFYTEFRGEEEANKLSAGEKATFQQETIKALQDRVENTRQAIDIADTVYKGANPDLREELIHAIATTKNVDTREGEINNELAKLTNGVINNRTEAVLGDDAYRASSTKPIKEILDDIAKEKGQTPELDEFAKQLNNIRNKDLTPLEANLLLHFAKISPTDFNYNLDRVLSLLDDSRKLRRRRQGYLDLYNTLFTEKGQKDFEDYQTKQEAQTAKAVEKEVATEEKKAEDTARVENSKKVVKKAEKVKIVDPNEDIVNTDDVIKNDDIPNVDFSNFEDMPDTIESPVVDNISTDTDLDVEEENIVKVETNKKDKNKNIEVRNTQESDEDFEVLDNINLDLKRASGNTISYLAVNKVNNISRQGDLVIESTSDLFDENGNLSINEYVDTKLFSNQHYNPGDTVRMIVPTFAQMQERGLQNYTEAQYNNDIRNKSQFPIAIVNDEDKIIGYLPTQSAIDRLVQDEYKETALQSNQALRDKIFDKKDNTFSITITQKSPGMVMRNSRSNQQSLFKALGDNNSLATGVSIGIGQNGLVKLKKGSNAIYPNNIINQDSIKDGVVYSIVPSSQKDMYVAVPMAVNQIGDTNARLILATIQLFGNPNPNGAQKQSLSNIKEYDFTNSKDVTNFINSIIYASTSPESNDRNYFKLNKSGLTLSKTNPYMKYSMNDILSNGEVQSDIIQILSQRYHTVDLDKLNSKDTYIGYEAKDLYGQPIINEVEYKNYQDYLDKNSIVTSNIAKVQIEGNNYAFTAQPVIALGDSISVEPELAQAEIERPEVKSEAKVKTQRKTTRIMFDPSKVKPKALEDIAPEFLQQQSIKSGEDLRKKCL